MQRFYAALIAGLCLLTISTPSEARRGSCDGIHRCRCGSTQTAHFGFPRIYNGHNLWQAREWIRAFPRTYAHVGAVGFQHHGRDHVFRIVSLISPGRAIVADDAGTYERNIGGAIFVDPNGSPARPAPVHYQRRASHVTTGLAYEERYRPL